ncbi:Rad2 nuclease [Entomortierella lignicola]|nr:Rad2 nuclease [Entomortierella lignicola]
MGIQGLLPLLKSVEKPVHLKDYAGQTLAVDGYVWLHKGAFACAQELCLDQVTQKYVTYFMRKIEMFKFFGVKPYVVFDGGYLPSKAITEQDRHKRREESKKQAMDLLRAGKSKQALEQFRKCVDVTPKMAFAVIQALEAAQVDFVVAPYEADAQLAFLEKQGLVDGIVTEDSDLLVFGCKKVIFKLDQFGAGIEILHKNIYMVRDISFHDWTMTEIRHMCILAGCDYLPSIPGMGLKTAQRLIRRFKTFERVIKHIRMENTNVKIPTDYEEAFHKADLTFLYARVYDPVSKSLVHLNTVPEELEELVQTEEYDFLGPVLEARVIQGIATGKLDPIHKTALDGTPVPRPTHTSSSGSFGKENRPYVDTRPSAKSIQTYFTKAIKHPAHNNDTFNDSGSVTKKRMLEISSESESVTLSVKPSREIGIIQLQENSSAKTKTDGVIVEARSRFFGFEASHVNKKKSPETALPRSPAVREDSGIGLDEASLLYTPNTTNHLSRSDKDQQEIRKSKSLPLKPAPTPTTSLSESGSQGMDNSQSASQESLDLKSAEAKVVQGWREKFSNPTGTSAGRSPGLSRAFQVNSSMVKNTLISSSQSMTPKAYAVQSSKTIFSLKSQSAQTVAKGIIRTIPGHPVHCLDTSRRQNINKIRSNSSNNVSGSLHKSRTSCLQSELGPSQVTEEASSMLNLDRFKYTPN